jgi:hypothetical protein
MRSPLRWFLVVFGLALWSVGTFAVDHLRDDAMSLADADIARVGQYQSGDWLKAYDTHLTETRSERVFFYAVEFIGFGVAVFSFQLSKRRADA